MRSIFGAIKKTGIISIVSKTIGSLLILETVLLFTSCNSTQIQTQPIATTSAFSAVEPPTSTQPEVISMSLNKTESANRLTSDPSPRVHSISSYPQDKTAISSISNIPLTCQVKDKIFFIHGIGENREIYWMPVAVANKKPKPFHNIRATCIFAFNNWLYYIDPENDFGLYKVDMNGQNKGFVYYCDPADIRYDKGYLYWTEFSDFQIMKLNLLTGEVTDLQDFMTDDFSISGDFLYARKAYDNQIIEINLTTGFQKETSCYGNAPIRVRDRLFTFFFSEILDQLTINDYHIDGSSQFYQQLKYPNIPRSVNGALAYKDKIILGTYNDGIYIYENEHMGLNKKIKCSPRVINLVENLLFIQQDDGMHIYDLSTDKFVLTPLDL